MVAAESNPDGTLPADSLILPPPEGLGAAGSPLSMPCVWSWREGGVKGRGKARGVPRWRSLITETNGDGNMCSPS